MGTPARTSVSDPRPPAVRIRARLHDLASELRDDLDAMDDPRARALFQSTAELLTALEEPFADLADRTVPA